MCVCADRPSTPACCPGSSCEATWTSSPVSPAGWARTLPLGNTPASFRSWRRTWVWSGFTLTAHINAPPRMRFKPVLSVAVGRRAAGRRSTWTTCTTCDKRCWARCRGAGRRAPAKPWGCWTPTSSSGKTWTASWRSAFGGISPTPTPNWTPRSGGFQT